MNAPLDILTQSVGNPVLRAQTRTAITESAIEQIRSPKNSTLKRLARGLLDRDIPERLVDQVIIGAGSVIDNPGDGVPEANDIRAAAAKILELKAKQVDAEAAASA